MRAAHLTNAKAGGRAKGSRSANLVIRSCLSSLQGARWHVVGSAAMAKRSPASSVPFVADGQRRKAVAAGGSPRALQEGRNRPDIGEENQDPSRHPRWTT